MMILCFGPTGAMATTTVDISAAGVRIGNFPAGSSALGADGTDDADDAALVAAALIAEIELRAA